MPLALAYLRVIFLAMPAILILIMLMMALARRRRRADAALVHDRRGGPRQPASTRSSSSASARRRRSASPASATATVIANYVGLIGADRLHLPARPAAAAARHASLRYLKPDPAILDDDRRQGPADGPADDRHLLLGAGDDRPRQPRGRRHHRRLRRRHAALDLCADAGDGARRRGQRDGRAEYRRRPLGPGQRDHPHRHHLQSADHRRPRRHCSPSPTGRHSPCSSAATARRCRSPGISSCSRPGASCCSA